MKSWSLNAKIYFVLSVLIVGSVIISFVGIQKMNEINASIDVLTDQTAVSLDRSHNLKELFLIQVINEKNTAVEENPEMIKTLNERTHARDQEIRKEMQNFAKTAVGPTHEGLKEFQALYEEWWKNTSEIQDLAATGKHKQAFELSKNLGRALRLKGEAIADSLVEINKKSMAEENARTDEVYAHGKMLVILTSFIAIFSGMILAYFIMREVSKTINGVIDNLSNNSTQVTTAAMQIAASSEELSQAANEQAAALEQTAAAIEQMNSMIQKNAENARQTSDLVINSKSSAENGKDSVNEMVSAIGEINESNQQMNEVVNVINEIGNKTKVINDIVFQTKLLSFNASVEAARAGEHGKGFAVVAEEVGNLAQMSGNAAKEISNLLDSSIQKVQMMIQNGQRKAEAGTLVAHRCGTILDVIVDNVSTVTRMAGEISSACQEQAQGIREIAKAMSQMEQVTQCNTTSSEDTANAAEELSAQSESLRSMVGVLVQTIQGRKEERELQVLSAKKVQANETPMAYVQKKKLKKPEAVSAFSAKKAHKELLPAQNDPRFEDV